MLSLLTEHLKGAGQAAAKSEQVNKTDTSIKNQLISNLINANRAENAKLRGKKRKRIEHLIDAQAFKRTKLDEGVGSRRTFTTSQEWYAGDLSGLKSCFSDWAVQFIKVTLPQLCRTSVCLSPSLINWI